MIGDRRFLSVTCWEYEFKQVSVMGLGACLHIMAKNVIDWLAVLVNVFSISY